MANDDQIQQLLAQKAAATPDQARRIRRQLRALGYRLSEVDRPGQPVGEKKERKARKPRSEGGQYPDLTGKKFTATPPMPESMVEELAVKLKADLEERSAQSLGEDEYGYGFDLVGHITLDTLMTKFNSRWPETPPKWFTLLGTPGSTRILLLGPVIPTMGR